MANAMLPKKFAVPVQPAIERRYRFLRTQFKPSFTSGSMAGLGVSPVRSGKTSCLRMGIMKAVETT